MPTRIILARQRTEISRLVISLLRLSGTYNTSVSDALICAAVYIGQFEGRPMTAGNISTYIGTPRPTVIRRLDFLIASGHVHKSNGTYQLPLDAINSAEIVAMVVESERLIQRTAAKLSEMDAATLAAKLPIK